jgi:hypothetical protein
MKIGTRMTGWRRRCTGMRGKASKGQRGGNIKADGRWEKAEGENTRGTKGKQKQSAGTEKDFFEKYRREADIGVLPVLEKLGSPASRRHWVIKS